MRRLTIPLILTFAMVAAMVWQALTPEAVLMPMPEVVFPEIQGASVEDQLMTETERMTLPEDTVIRRRLYRFENGHWLLISAVIGGRSKNSVHRPELCLPGQGFQMTEPRMLYLEDVPWRVLSLERSEPGKLAFAYTFTDGAGFRTSSHVARIFKDVWDRSVCSRINRWVMLTVSTSVTSEVDLRALLENFSEVVK